MATSALVRSRADGGLVVVVVVRAGDRVLLRVDDAGPGIPAENREDIFRRF